jgi:hypothetical protein
MADSPISHLTNSAFKTLRLMFVSDGSPAASDPEWLKSLDRGALIAGCVLAVWPLGVVGLGFWGASKVPGDEGAILEAYICWALAAAIFPPLWFWQSRQSGRLRIAVLLLALTVYFHLPGREYHPHTEHFCVGFSCHHDHKTLFG